MLPESLQPQLSHPCAHPDCCGHDAAETETPLGNPAGTLAQEPKLQEGGRWTAIKRHVLWFLAFFGIYASSSVCPFCGTPGCPVGVGGAAVVGGAFAFLWQYGKSAWEKLKGSSINVSDSLRKVIRVAGEDRQFRHFPPENGLHQGSPARHRHVHG